jgi:putative sterol carrier protein
MAAFLSEEWAERQQERAADLPERPGASARVQYVVTGAPGGEVRYHQTVVDGRVVELTIGEDPDADVTLTQTYADAVQIATGALEAATAFMQGRTKVVGPMGPVMALLPLIQSDEYLSALADVAAVTDF